jgi:HEAT repeat protein
VRESAARGLGLIADPAALTALEQAAQLDGDRDVRHSAAFAAEVIRAHQPHP